MKKGPLPFPSSLDVGGQRQYLLHLQSSHPHDPRNKMMTDAVFTFLLHLAELRVALENHRPMIGALE